MSVIDHAASIRRLVADGWQFDTIYDVGANIGGWTQATRAACPEACYHMFEPLIGHDSDLDAQAMHTGLRNSTLHPIALSDETGTARMKILGDRGEGSSLLIVPSDARKPHVYAEVPVWRMDDYVTRHNLPKPDFIKLDVQAAEMKVLRGAPDCLRHARFVLLETWLRRVYGPETPLFHEVAAWMYDQGYVLFDMLSLQDGRDPNGDLRWCDAIFANRAHSRHAPALL